MRNAFRRPLFSCLFAILMAAWSVSGVEDTACRKNRDCVTKVGLCFAPKDPSGMNMCVCKNGLSNYPSCESDTKNYGRCDEDCSKHGGYCDRFGYCLCEHGGMYPETCCKKPCEEGYSCYKGICTCKYGKRRDRQGCTQCEESCGSLAKCDEKRENAQCHCKYGGQFPACQPKKLQDCKQWCGPHAECHQGEEDKIVCTKCRPGYEPDTNNRCTQCAYGKLRSGRGCTACEDFCGDLAKCDEKTAAATGSKGQCKCKYGGAFPDCPKIDCTKSCGPNSECKKNDKGKTICTKCERGRKKIRGRCYYFGQWLPWGECSATCGEGVQKRERECPAGEKRCLKGTKAKASSQACRLKACLANWADWGEWSACTSSCGGGFHKRSRSCPDKILGCGAGSDKQLEECNTEECKAELGEWGPWSTCPACGSGPQTRTRPCLTAPAIQCGMDALSQSRACAAKPPPTTCMGKPTLAQIAAAPTFRARFVHPDHAKNWFEFRCEGGCIEPASGIVTCDSSGKRIKDYLNTQCKGKTGCSFIPGPMVFGLTNCSGYTVTISLKCVGGTACSNHRQAENGMFNNNNQVGVSPGM